MRFDASVKKKKYLRELRLQMESWFAFGQPRFTGLVLGSFFYITRHAGYEWNRRVTNEKHRAIGFVTKQGERCAVHAVFIPGYLDPLSLVWYYLICMVIFWIYGLNPWVHFVPNIIAVGVALLSGVISAVASCVTERGREAFDDLLTLLNDPVRFWAASEE